MALFLYSFNTVAPLILVVAVGFLLKKLRMVDDAFISKANKVCFQVAFPLQLFHNIYAADFGAHLLVIMRTARYIYRYAQALQTADQIT